MNVYRLMELFILSAVENIELIKSVEAARTDYADKNVVLSLRLKANSTVVDEDLLKKIMDHVRGMIKLTVGHNEHGSELSNENVETVLKDLVSRIADKEEGLRELTPRSLRELIRSSKIADKDMAKIRFEFENKAERNECIKVRQSRSTEWLFPFDCRKLSGLSSEDIGKIKLKLTKILPQSSKMFILKVAI